MDLKRIAAIDKLNRWDWFILKAILNLNNGSATRKEVREYLRKYSQFLKTRTGSFATETYFFYRLTDLVETGFLEKIPGSPVFYQIPKDKALVIGFVVRGIMELMGVPG